MFIHLKRWQPSILEHNFDSGGILVRKHFRQQLLCKHRATGTNDHNLFHSLPAKHNLTTVGLHLSSLPRQHEQVCRPSQQWRQRRIALTQSCDLILAPVIFGHPDCVAIVRGAASVREGKLGEGMKEMWSIFGKVSVYQILTVRA